MKKSIIPILLVLTLALGIGLRIHNLDNVRGRSPDEQVHTYQANIVLQNGPILGVRKLVDEYNKDEKQWLFPKPIRVGYVWPLAALMKITGQKDVTVGSYLSCFFSILSLVILVILALRFFNRYVALYALLFMSVSSIPLAISRRTWSDAMLEFLGILLIYFSCEIIRSSKWRWLWYLPFVAIGSYAALVKESGAVFYGLCVIWIIWALFIKDKSVVQGLILAGTSMVGAALSVAVTLYVSGGLTSALDVMKHFSEALPGNTYAALYQTGPWHQFVGGFLIVSPLTSCLCLIALVRIKENRDILFGIVFFMTALIILTLAAPLSQNMRYVSPAFGIFYLLGGVGLWRILAYTKERADMFTFSFIAVVLAGVLSLGAIRDYQGFRRIFIRTGIVDTSIKLLRDNSRL